jgi:hypothetical protein
MYTPITHELVIEKMARFELEAANYRLVKSASSRKPRSWFLRRRTSKALPTNAVDPLWSTTAMPAPATAEFRVWATALGHQLAESGARPVERQLKMLARLARQNQVASVSSSVLGDRSQPEVARARAFSRVVTALVELAPATTASQSSVA